MALKPGQGHAYAHAIDDKCIPIFQNFRGFRDEIAMVSADGKEGIGISFWDGEEDAEAYDSAGYADVHKALEPFYGGTPEVRKYRITTSTVHALRARNNFGRRRRVRDTREHVDDGLTCVVLETSAARANFRDFRRRLC